MRELKKSFGRSAVIHIFNPSAADPWPNQPPWLNTQMDQGTPPTWVLIRRRQIKPNLATFRVWRVIAKDWRDVEPMKVAQIYAKPTLYNIKQVLILQ